MEESMKTHKIATIQDIANATNPDNIDDFLLDLKGILLGYHLVKESCPDIRLNQFTWIDDGKHEINVTLIEKK